MHSKRDNIEIVKYDRVDEVIEDLFVFIRYQIGFETSMRSSSDFIFDCVIFGFTNAIK